MFYRISTISLIYLISTITSLLAQSALVPLGSDWHYLDDGSDQGGAWQAVGFDDSSWAVGPAELGYGDGGEATVVSFGVDSANKHTTTYFRHGFNVADPAQWPALQLSVQRDDGVIVYLNGQEIFRDNMPGGSVSSSTFASSAVGGASETQLLTAPVDPSLLLTGGNILAVEIHQANLTSSDISFDLSLAEPPPPGIVRGPYLQKASAAQTTVCWRTNVATDAVVHYGTDPANLNLTASSPTVGTDHAVTIAGLSAATTYYYSVGDSSNTFASGTDHYFETHPISGTAAPTRIWVLGDSGTANASAAAVRDAFVTHNGGDPHADLLLMLGDNAYNDGTDSQFQAAVFDMYPQTLRNTVLWSTLGNHDGHSADSATQSGPYYDIHHFPTAAESGGLASGTEAYYSFDYANIHFVCLDSYETDRSPTGAMASWLENDLASTTQEWVIAFWHHPPYSKGSHDSDTESYLVQMRENFLPILENYGVDLVLGGHSHSYERSILIDGHYDVSSTFDASMVVDGGDGDPSGDGAYSKVAGDAQSGAVYVVAGSSGKITSAPLNHPVMISNFVELGSMVLDVDANQLNAVFLNSAGAVRDEFTIVHDTSSQSPAAPSGLGATVLGYDQIDLAWTDNADNEDAFVVERSLDGTTWATAANLAADSASYSDTGLSADTTYHYRVFATNANGASASSNVASATTSSLPAYLDSLANAETPVHGTLSGDYLLTHSDDGSTQSITEVESGGKPSRRHSRLEHTWSFTLPAGTSSTLFANASSGGSTDGDEFEFSYSSDGGASWQQAFVVSSTDQANLQTAPLTSATAGSLLIRVTDTDSTEGNRALDTVYIDELYVRTETIAGDPPAAPSNLSATAATASQIDLAWTDHAIDELGFEIERLTGGGSTWDTLANVAADATSYSDLSAAPNTSYSYRVRAYNASGASDFSSTASATTPDGIALTATGYKVKGVIHADLAWTNISTANVDIYRDGVLIDTVANTGTFTDNTGVKGSASFSYVVCEESNPSACSNAATVSF